MTERYRSTLYGKKWRKLAGQLPTLAELETRKLNNDVAVRIARENLIEKLGKHMCGEGGGPTAKEQRAFNHISRIAEKVRRDIASHLALPLIEHLTQANKTDES